MPARRLKIDQLLLDHQNPRITTASAQREALEKIIADQGTKLTVLAESIVEEGLNPIERMLVVPSGDDPMKYVVVEGNRRLAALKILKNPHVLADLEVSSAMQARFDRLSSNFDTKSVEPIDAFVVSDRAEAATWIQLRHTGENKGRGVVSWSGVASRRFRGRDPALQALDTVTNHGSLSSEDRNAIEARFPISTLDRLLSTPAVRSLVGVDIESGKLVTKLPADEAIKPLKRMVLDLARGVRNVSHLKKKEDQIGYVKGFGIDLPDLNKAIGASKPVDAFTERDFSKAPSPKPKSKPKKSPRKTLIPRDCQLNVSVPKLAEIEKELRGLQLDKFPHAISVLLRVFLETSVDQFPTSNGIALTIPVKGRGPADKKLRAKIKDAIDHMTKSGVNQRDLAGFEKGIDDNKSPIYVDLLHNYVHNRFVTPTERELVVAWDNARPFFEYVWR